jgi:hypothetical protein
MRGLSNRQGTALGTRWLCSVVPIFSDTGQIYLLESKWEKCHLPEADLLVFRGKIEGKSTFTRGVFIALNDISTQALDAITRGKAASFFVVNG